nr:MAG TPA: hypothetical protein [Caudoviricetes sp.]
MALTLSANNETEFKPIPAGTHHATCIRIIDLGTQKVEFNNEIKFQHKILIQWEINANGDPELQTEDGAPLLISKRYTASLNSKSKLSADLKAWRGREFTPEELEAFDLRNILGKTCLIGISHTEKNGNTYANIASISNKMKNYEPPAPHNEVFAFDLDAPDYSVFAKLSDKLKEVITATPEWAELKKAEQSRTPPAPPAKQGAATAQAAQPQEEITEDIPF